MSRLPKTVPSTKTVTTTIRPRPRRSGSSRPRTTTTTVRVDNASQRNTNRRTRRRRRAQNTIRTVSSPLNTIDSLSKGVAQHATQHGFNSLVAAYMACLANPFEYKARIPDIYSKRTSIFHSIQQIDLPVHSPPLPTQMTADFLLPPSP